MTNDKRRHDFVFESNYYLTKWFSEKWLGREVGKTVINKQCNKIFLIHNFQPAKNQIYSKTYWKIYQPIKMKIIKILKKTIIIKIIKKSLSIKINQNQLKSIKQIVKTLKNQNQQNQTKFFRYALTSWSINHYIINHY